MSQSVGSRKGLTREIVSGVAAKLWAALLLVTALAWVLPGYAGEFKLRSDTFSDGGRMSRAQLHFSCGGDNISPHLSWQGAPAGTKSYAVMVHDPDAPSENGWWHWVVFNIPASVTELAEGAGNPKAGLIPEAVQGRNDFKSPGYGGACPPKGHGDHRYQFKVYALKVEQLPLDTQSPAALVEQQVNANKLAQAQLEVTFGR